MKKMTFSRISVGVLFYLPIGQALSGLAMRKIGESTYVVDNDSASPEYTAGADKEILAVGS
ncbi:MAG: hypothetical protein RB292_04060 [Patescibacteria group bacterium]|jgi:hypothetical protein|nr:hypothetical protein [Patescibacteria group bacterium]